MNKINELKKLIGNTPLIKIVYKINGNVKNAYFKLEWYNLTGSIKDRVALSIIEEAYQNGNLKPGQTIVETTSGNMGISFSAIGKYLGHKVVIFMPKFMSKERQELLKLFGAELHLTESFEEAFVKAKEYLKKFGLDNKVKEFDTSSATVKEAAVALNCKEAEIAKTLSFLVGGKPILIVTAGNRKIDNAKYKSKFNEKAKMIKKDEVESLIGHKVGGVCPFGINDGVDVYLDISLKDFDIIYPACGSSNSAVKLTIEELETSSNYKEWIDVCKIIEEG